MTVSVKGTDGWKPLTNFDARIVCDRVEDDGVEVRRTFEIRGRLNDRTATCAVAASAFGSLQWVLDLLGAGAIVYAGQSVRDHARQAIQELSGDIPEHRIHLHTGWIEREGRHMYLTGNGAVAADGLVQGVDVKLKEVLAHFAFPEPASPDALRVAVRASLDIVRLGPPTVTYPLLATAYRAVLGPADFGLFLSGPTQIGKSEYAALAQQHYGRGFDSRSLPASWLSTGNALRELAFQAKDALLVIDDFAPSGSPADVQRLNREAESLLRGQGNSSPRLRMRADGTVPAGRPSRATILSTGEDVPNGESLRARLFIVEVGPGDMRWEELGAAQKAAGDGVYAAAMSGFVRFLVPDKDGHIAQFRRLAHRYRDSVVTVGKRTSSQVAELAATLELLVDYATTSGALTQLEADEWLQAGQLALVEVAARQSEQQAAANPVLRFEELLRASLSSGSAFLEPAAGARPIADEASWEAFGWTRVARWDGDAWEPRGERVGWVAGDDLYLEPEAAYGAASKMVRGNAIAIPVPSKTLCKRIAQAGLLVSTETRGDRRYLVRKTLGGARRGVLHLRASAFLGASLPVFPALPALPAQSGAVSGDRELEGETALWAGNGAVDSVSGPLIGPHRPPIGPEPWAGTEVATGASGPVSEVTARSDGPEGPEGPVLEGIGASTSARSRTRTAEAADQPRPKR